MKLRKLIVPALLSLGVLGGVAFAGNETQQVSRVAAMSEYTGDPDIDCGVNVHVEKKAGGSWVISQFSVTQFENANASQGDYLAFRLKGNNGAGSYIDLVPNTTDGNAFRVPADNTTVVEGVKCIPAGPSGEAWAYNGGRGWDLPMNFGYDWDLWFCIPKTSFTRKYFGDGDAMNWNCNLFAIYFMFYGETPADTIDFDIGNVYTANIVDGHLQKVTRLINWADINGFTNVNFVGANDKQMLNATRCNEETYKPAAKFIQAIEGVDSCNATEATAAYNANKDAYTALNPANKEYLLEAVIGDYADGDTSHEGAKTTAYHAMDKWEQICKAAGHPINNSLYVPASTFDPSKTIIVIAASTLSIIAFGLFLSSRKRKTTK